MVKITKEAALAYHENGRPGKIEVIPTKSHSTQTDFKSCLLAWSSIPLFRNSGKSRQRLQIYR